jgi:proprotein convertase subtilisin/kexin type 5
MSRVRYFPTLVLRNSITSLALIIIWLADNINTACHSSCLSCIGATVNDCTQCKYDRELVPTTSGSNVGQCKCLSIYFEDGSGSCVPCHPQCRTCSGSSDTQCLSCEDGAVLLGSSPSRCVCNARMFMNLDTGVCLPCHSTCATCNGIYSYNCLSCDNGVTLDVINYKCYCSGGSYFDATTHSCKPCHSSCLTCDGPLPNNCLTCDEATQQYQIHGECWPICNPTCKTCTGPLDTNCKTCYDNFYLDPSGKCLVYPGFKIQSPSNPPTAVALDPVIDCDGRCANCKSISDRSLCIECSTSRNMVLTSEGTCACPSNSYYYDTAANTCKPCDSSCKTCDPSQATKCHSCSTSTLQRTVLDTSAYRCLCDFSGTKATTYISSTNQCEPCGPNGRTCFTAIDKYTSCNVDAFLNTAALQQICTCYSTYHEINPSTGLCKLRKWSTEMCLRADDNGSCPYMISYSMLNTGDEIVCIPGYFYQSSENRCVRCKAGCSICHRIDTCDTLNPGITMVSQTYTCTNPNEYFHAPTGLCYACHPTCASCLDGLPNSCLSCMPGLSKTVGVGFCKCSDGYYYSSSSNSCETCDSSCATCVDANNCLTCKPNSYRASDGSCTCLYNYNLLPPTLSCVPCDEKCRGCTIMASTCSDCAPDSGIITAFPQRTYCKIGTPLVRLANGQASVCHPSCLTCKMGSSLPSSCVTCVPGASVDPTTGFCMCQPGCFMKNDFTACVVCPSPCLTCIPGSANLGICTELISTDPREMQSTTGLTKCRTSNSFYDGSNKVCKPCDSTCKNCKGPLTGDCYSCKDPKAQFITSSPVGSCHCIQGFAMDINGMCVRCHLTCLACSIPGDANSCTACDTGAMVLSGNICISSDPTNFPINTTSGMANMYNCHSSCKSCNVANSPTACTSCHLNAQLSSGRCNCRSGYGREPNDPSFICFECHFLCTACDGNKL